MNEEDRKREIIEDMKKRVIIEDKRTGKYFDSCILIAYSAFRFDGKDYFRIRVRHHDGSIHNYDTEVSKIIDVVDNYLKPWVKRKKGNDMIIKSEKGGILCQDQ